MHEQFILNVLYVKRCIWYETERIWKTFELSQNSSRDLTNETEGEK